MVSIITTALKTYVMFQPPWYTSHEIMDEMFEVSLITLACILPTLFTLKYETESVCRWLNTVRRISRRM